MGNKNSKKNNVKYKKIIDANGVVETNELKKLIYIFLIVLSICTLIYVLTALFNKNQEEIENVEIQYEEIIVGEIFNVSRGSYYILATMEDDKNSNLYKTHLTNYINSNGLDISYYYININSIFNRNYIALESNFNIDNISDIKFKTSTLIKIEDKKIKEVYEGNDEIIRYLSSN